jgi:uncharacterized protein
MAIGTIGAVFRDVLNSGLAADALHVYWHAGEPLVLPRDYYAEAFAAINAVNLEKRHIEHRFQSNGTLLDNGWCRFILQHKLHFGLSIDGPAGIHDLHRRMRNGTGTHDAALRALKKLQAHGIPFSVIAVLSRESLLIPEAIIDFFIDCGVDEVGFNIEEIEAANQTSSLGTAETDELLQQFWPKILKRIYQRGSTLRIREIEWAVDRMQVEQRPLYCVENEPLAILSVDVDGNYYTFSPELVGAKTQTGESFRIGNVFAGGLAKAISSKELLQIAGEVRTGVDACRNSCSYFGRCGGGAPANKYFETASFASTETMHCRYTVKLFFDVMETILRVPTAIPSKTDQTVIHTHESRVKTSH